MEFDALLAALIQAGYENGYPDVERLSTGSKSTLQSDSSHAKGFPPLWDALGGTDPNFACSSHPYGPKRTKCAS